MKKIILLIALVAMIASATENTQSYTTKKVTITNYGDLYRFTNTFAGATDTATFTIPYGIFPTQDDTLMYQINVATISGNGDSVDLSVRFEISTDNSTWYSYTLGTDSTSWVSTTTGTTYKAAAPVLIGAPNYGGYYPYNRIRVIGNAGNQTGGAGVYTKVRVDVWLR